MRYVLDKTSSKFTVRAYAGGMLSSLGHSPTFLVREFEGEGILDPLVPEQVSVTLRIRAASLEVMDDIKSSDRQEIEKTMNASVLESARYPDIVFQSTGASATRLSESLYQVKVNGTLSLHGVKKPMLVSARVAVLQDSLRISGDVPLAQSQFAIEPVSIAGGTLKIKDELKLSFDIVARKES